jgi:hypothetical protein
MKFVKSNFDVWVSLAEDTHYKIVRKQTVRILDKIVNGRFTHRRCQSVFFFVYVDGVQMSAKDTLAEAKEYCERYNSPLAMILP